MGMRYQPQGRIRIDRNRPLGRRVIDYFPLRNNISSGISGRMGTVGTGGSFRASSVGVGLRGAGTGSRGSIPLDLSKYSAITIAFWMNWDSYANNDAVAIEFTNGFNTGASGFYIDPNSSGAAGRFEVAGFNTGSAGANGGSFPRPSAGEWHRYCISINRVGSGASTLCFKAYVDGVLQSTTQHLGGTLTGNFANSTLHLLSRNGVGLFGAGSLQDITIYEGVLSDADARADYFDTWQIFEDPSDEGEYVVSSSTTFANTTGLSSGQSGVSTTAFTVKSSRGDSLGNATVSGNAACVWLATPGSSGAAVAHVVADSAMGTVFVDTAAASYGTSTSVTSANVLHDAIAYAIASSSTSSEINAIVTTTGAAVAASMLSISPASINTANGISNGLSANLAVSIAIQGTEARSVSSSEVQLATQQIVATLCSTGGNSTVSGTTEGGIHYTARGDRFSIHIAFSAYKVSVDSAPYKILIH